MSPSIATPSTGNESVIWLLLQRLGIIFPTILAFVLAYTLICTLLDPLRKVPGPFLARFTRLWELKKVREGHFEQVNIELHRQHGPIVRLAPGRYSIDDGLATKQIYGLGSKFVKDNFYLPLGHPQLKSMFSESDPAKHWDKKRRLAAFYSMSTLVSYEPFVDQCTNLLISKLSFLAEKEQNLDIPTWMQFYAFDVIGEITVGKSFGMMETGYDSSNFLTDFDASMAYSAQVGVACPEWHPWISWLSIKLRLPNPNRSAQDFIGARIMERKVGKTSSDRADFLSKMVALQEQGKMDALTLRYGVGANIAAGSDTTAVTLSSVVYYLLRNPDCFSKLRNEIEAFENEGKMSDPIKFSEAQQMPYLQAVIKEALRMHPATGQPLSRVVPPGGAHISGQFFPAGTSVGVNPWVLHANTKVFGPDADKFRPERWLGPKEEISTYTENLFSFGAGSRTCIGKNISLLEMNKVIVQIYRKFNIEDVDKQKPIEWSTRNMFFVKPNFVCRITPRELKI